MVFSCYEKIYWYFLSVFSKKQEVWHLSFIDGTADICYHISTTQVKEDTFLKGGTIMNWAAIVWLVLMVLFLAVEAATVSMTSLWFAAGALAALLIALLGGAVWLQTLLFLAVSAGLLAVLRPLVRRYVAPKVTATNVDSVVGTTGLVTAAIDNVSAAGQVKLGGMVWTARSTTGEPIPEGTRVKVDKIEGVKVFVSPVQVPAKL